nr:glycosyltransferase family 39 protein [uncultured Lichenicoccus sp.]
MASRLTVRHQALLTAFVLAIFLPGRASLPPLDRDEPRYMEASAQMLQSGNYVDVRFQDQPRYLQPAGIYWLEAATVALTGTLEHRQVWGWRIPSLIAVVGSTLLTASIGASLFGPEAGLFAALLLTVSVLMTAEGRMATIDSTLLLSILLTEFALLRIWSSRHDPGPAPGWTVGLYWASLGFGLMLKGPVALIPGFGTPIALALTERDAGWWKRLRPVWGVPLMLAIVLPWCIAIWLVSHGTFFSRAVGTNLLGKVASGQQAHGLPPGYHLLVFAIAFWPGSLFAACAIPFAWLRRRQDPVRFLLCWIIPHWVVFELIATKLPHYVLPTYPAIAVLAAAALVTPQGWEPPRRLAGRVLLAAYGLVWLVVGVGIAGAGPLLLWRLQHVVSPVASFVSVLAVALVLASAWLLWPLREPRRALGFVAAAALATYASLFIVVLPALRTIWLSPRIAAMVEQVRPCPDSVLASTSFSEPSLVFLVGPATRLIGPVAAADLLATDRRCAMALVGSRDAAVFQASLAKDGITVRQLGRLDGVNYSTGRHLDLALFKARQ